MIPEFITIIGWLVTAIIQFIILKNTRTVKNLDRELAVFRERLATVRSITSLLIDHQETYLELAAHLLSKSFDFAEETKTTQKTNANTDLAKVLCDPAFLSIQNLLPQQNAERLNAQIKKAMEMAGNFHTKSIGLSSNPNFDTVRVSLAEESIEVAQVFIETAKMFGDEYAILDQKLAKNK